MSIEMKKISVELIRGNVVSREKNSKGDSVEWLRVAKDVKDNAAFTITTKDNKEYAAKLPTVGEIEVGIYCDWLKANAGMLNVQEWFANQFIAADRALMQEAGAAGKDTVEVLADIEALVAYETLQSARGRKASKFDADQWKAFSPVLSDCLAKFFTEKKVQNVVPLVNKYLHLIKGAIVGFTPIGDDAHAKATEMLGFTFTWIIEHKPDMEALAAFAVSVMQANGEKYKTDEDASGY